MVSLCWQPASLSIAQYVNNTFPPNPPRKHKMTIYLKNHTVYYRMQVGQMQVFSKNKMEGATHIGDQ
jgi:hypothetical protein